MLASCSFFYQGYSPIHALVVGMFLSSYHLFASSMTTAPLCVRSTRRLVHAVGRQRQLGKPVGRPWMCVLLALVLYCLRNRLTHSPHSVGELSHRSSQPVRQHALGMCIPVSVQHHYISRSMQSKSTD